MCAISQFPISTRAPPVSFLATPSHVSVALNHFGDGTDVRTTILKISVYPVFGRIPRRNFGIHEIGGTTVGTDIDHCFEIAANFQKVTISANICDIDVEENAVQHIHSPGVSRGYRGLSGPSDSYIWVGVKRPPRCHRATPRKSVGRMSYTEQTRFWTRRVQA